MRRSPTWARPLASTMVVGAADGAPSSWLVAGSPVGAAIGPRDCAMAVEVSAGNAMHANMTKNTETSTRLNVMGTTLFAPAERASQMH